MYAHTSQSQGFKRCLIFIANRGIDGGSARMCLLASTLYSKNPRAQDKQHLPSHACPRQGHVLPEAHTRFLLQVPLRLDMHARVELAHPSLLTHAHGQGSMSARAHERRPQGRLRVSRGVHGCEMRVTT